jgi:hypothetical protein
MLPEKLQNIFELTKNENKASNCVREVKTALKPD